MPSDGQTAHERKHDRKLRRALAVRHLPLKLPRDTARLSYKKVTLA